MAEALSQKLDVDEKTLVELLSERERLGSTVLNPFLAIPHIVIEGKNVFEILLVRCEGGIHFSPKAQKVRAVFVLACSKDERSFHLQALAAIAQIVHDSDFGWKWIRAKGKEALRDIVLLGKRVREGAHEDPTEPSPPK